VNWEVPPLLADLCAATSSNFFDEEAKKELSICLLPFFQARDEDIRLAGEFLTFLLVRCSEPCIQYMFFAYAQV